MVSPKNLQKIAFLTAIPTILIMSIAPSQAFQLNFDPTPNVTSGTNLTAGATYKYPGVATSNGITIDAVLKIDALVNSATLSNPNNSIDRTDQGFTQNVQPSLNGPTAATTSGLEPRAAFSVSFLNQTSGNPIGLNGLTAIAQDVDGDGQITREGVRFYGANTVTTGTSLTRTTGTDLTRGAFVQGLATTTTNQMDIGSGAAYQATASYANNTSSIKFDYLYARSGTGGSLPRLNSLDLQATEAVPFEFSPTLGLVLSGMGIGLYQWRKYSKAKQSNNFG